MLHSAEEESDMQAIETKMRGTCVNRGERMRWRSTYIEGAAGRYRNREKLLELSREAHTIRSGEWERVDGYNAEAET